MFLSYLLYYNVNFKVPYNNNGISEEQRQQQQYQPSTTIAEVENKSHDNYNGLFINIIFY